MAFRSNFSTRRALASRPVRSVKQIVDGIFLAVASGVTTSVEILTAVNDYTGTVGTCPIGATVKAVSLQVSYSSGAATSTAFDWYIQKNPFNILSAGTPVPGSTGSATSRRFIFHEEKGLTGNVGDGTLTKNNVLVLIPPRFRRMGENDKLRILARNSNVSYNFCIKVIYKWFA